VSALQITIGRGLKIPQGERVTLDAAKPAADLARVLDGLTGEAWWAPHTWEGDHRRRENWRAAAFVALDLDWHDAAGKHAAPPPKKRDELDFLLRTLATSDALDDAATVHPGDGAVLAHGTPRGHRLVLMLREPLDDFDRYARAMAGSAHIIDRALFDAGLCGEKGATAGFIVDRATFDGARMLWAPRAKPPTETAARAFKCAHFGTPGRAFDAGALAALAPADTPTRTDAPAEPELARWGELRAALASWPGASDRGDRVGLCCPYSDQHDDGKDETPSAVVFSSGRLWCSAENKSRALREWVREHGERLPAPLRAALGAPAVGLAALWRTVADWQAADGAAWFTDEPPPRRWLLKHGRHTDVRDILPMGKVGMLAAAGGVGKTMALVQLALAVATGKPWLPREHNGEGGFLTPDGGGRVLLALGEEDALEVRRRLYRAGQTMRAARLATPDELDRAAARIVVLPLAGTPVALVDAPDPRIGRAAEPSKLAADLGELLERGGPWSLVILDPLSRFAGTDTETDNAAATRFVQILEGFTKAPGEPAVLVAHHTTKAARQNGTDDDTAARGSSALSDGVRWHAALRAERHPEGAKADVPRMATFSVVKSNYGAFLAEPLWLARGMHGELRAATDDERARFKAARSATPTGGAETPKRGRIPTPDGGRE
jgi:hypothetical protein